jgi:CheY-like chemotaxis protein/HD-like signal output (HDOD) protein
MSKVLIVDDLAIFRDLITAALRHAGYDTAVAANTTEAAAMIRASRPDLILLDIAMPGVDGLTLMEQLRASPATADIPIIVLTAAVDKQCVVRASRLHPQGYLLKSAFSLDELLARVQKFAPLTAIASSATTTATTTGAATAATSTPPTPPPAPPLPRISRDDCTRRAIDALPARTLGGVVGAVIFTAGSPRADLSELANMIARDVSLSARVIRTANSAAYAKARGPVTTVHDAVRIIGSSAVRNIAVTLGIFDVMPKNHPDGYNPIFCWQHSFAVARLCEHLFNPGPGPNPAQDTGVAYIVGLCHDLGELVFRERFGPEYRAIMDCHQRTQRPWPDIEREVLGMTHGELVLAILHHFGLPAAIADPIEQFHHSPSSADTPLVRILRMADHYANGLSLASSASAKIAPFARAYCRHAAGNEAPLLPNLFGFRNEIIAMTGLLAQLNPRDQAAFLEPSFPRTDSRIWLAREGSLSEFDPVQTFLESIAQVTVASRLPTPDEHTRIDGLVIMAHSTAAKGLDDADLSAVLRRFPLHPTPALRLVGSISAAYPISGELPAPVIWPVSLRLLAEFVQATAAQGQSSASDRAA